MQELTKSGFIHKSGENTKSETFEFLYAKFVKITKMRKYEGLVAKFVQKCKNNPMLRKHTIRQPTSESPVNKTQMFCKNK